MLYECNDMKGTVDRKWRTKRASFRSNVTLNIRIREGEFVYL